jgi:hypothetical protein
MSFGRREKLVDCDVAEVREDKDFDEYNAVRLRIPSFHLSGVVGEEMIIQKIDMMSDRGEVERDGVDLSERGNHL